MSTLGYVSSPNSRGTIDILWSCIATITLCCWSSLCLNVPASEKKERRRFFNKFGIAVVGIVGPEFLGALAAGQYESACQSVKKFRTAGYSAWTMRHAFFADMGGFQLEVPIHEPSTVMPAGYVPKPLTFPIDAEQLFYLVDLKYIEYPEVHKDDLADSDGLARHLTIIQVIWFTINSIGRLIQHLPITTLELTTLAFIPWTIATRFWWYHKPSPVGRATVLQCSTPIERILKDASADLASKPFKTTPLDFASRDDWSVSIGIAYLNNSLRKLNLRSSVHDRKGRSITHSPNINFRRLHRENLSITALLTAGYCAIFAAGWNLPFPTRIERTLWRVSSVGTFIVLGASYLFDFTCFRLYIPHRQHCLQTNQVMNLHEGRDVESWLEPDAERVWYGYGKTMNKARRLAARLRNNSPDRDPAMEVPLRVLIPGCSIFACYGLFRLYFLVEDAIGFRAMSPGVFETFEWSSWFPHV